MGLPQVYHLFCTLPAVARPLARGGNREVMAARPEDLRRLAGEGGPAPDEGDDLEEVRTEVEEPARETRETTTKEDDEVPDLRIAVFMGRAKRDDENAIGFAVTNCGRDDLPRPGEIGCRFSIDPTEGPLGESDEELLPGRIEGGGRTGLTFYKLRELQNEANDNLFVEGARERGLKALLMRKMLSLPSSFREPTKRAKRTKKVDNRDRSIPSDVTDSD